MWEFRYWGPTCFGSTTGGSGGGGGGGGSSDYVPVAIPGAGALRLIIPTTEYEMYDLLYLNYPGDGSGGKFVYMPNDSNSDDGIDYIIPAAITRPTTGTFVRTTL